MVTDSAVIGATALDSAVTDSAVMDATVLDSVLIDAGALDREVTDSLVRDDEYAISSSGCSRRTTTCIPWIPTTNGGRYRTVARDYRRHRSEWWRTLKSIDTIVGLW